MINLLLQNSQLLQTTSITLRMIRILIKPIKQIRRKSPNVINSFLHAIWSIQRWMIRHLISRISVAKIQLWHRVSDEHVVSVVGGHSELGTGWAEDCETSGSVGAEGDHGNWRVVGMTLAVTRCIGLSHVVAITQS